MAFSLNYFLFAFISVVCFLLLLFIDSKPFVSAIITRKQYSELQHNTHHHSVPLTSLSPSSTCTSPQGRSRKGWLEVVHKHGPCSKPKQHTSSSSSSSFIMPHSEILKQDKARVRSIHSKLSKTRTQEISSKGSDQIQFLAKSGVLLGTGNYFITVGLGSPKRDLFLEFDTGSDLTWTQCQPCDSCYHQNQPIFDPSQSSSFSNIPCSSSHCSCWI